MELNQRIKYFVKLGDFLRDYSKGKRESEYSNKLDEVVVNDHIYNPWFTENNVKQAISAIAESLQSSKLETWINQYPREQFQSSVKNIGVITAGNIPLVGFHDFITILLSGNRFLGKLSTKDNRLLKFIADYLIAENNDFNELIEFTEDKLQGFEAVIAPGSNNT